MKRAVFASLVFFAVALTPLFALDARVTGVTGKVQLRAPGAGWVNARIGSLVTPGTVVATGFNSTAVLNLGTSHLQVKQLTRLTLRKLLRTHSTATTSLYLTVGEVHANVADNLGITQKFKIQSPVSTAAVRGTIFTFNAFSVTVHRGVVDFSTNNHLRRLVAKGQTSTLRGSNVPQSASVVEQQSNGVQVSPPTGGSSQSGAPIGPVPAGSSGSVTITVQ